MINIDDAFVDKYAKRIMSFSYHKTQDYNHAEDLAQEILLQLSIALDKQHDIQNIDSYVTTICKYTWSNFLKKNKKHWDNSDIDTTVDLSCSTNIEQEVENKLLCEKLRKEVSYLCKIHRKIIIAFYYNNKTTKVIANELNMNESTVRWHLSETRKELKKAMEIKENNLDFEPVRANCGHDGYCADNSLYGLNDDLLTQNIAYACYGEPLSLSEISRKLNVAAAYLESRVAKLVEMDYLQVINNRYQTTFYIETPENIAVDAEFAFNNITPFADRLFEEVNKRMDDIMNIKFIGHEYLYRSDIEWMILNRLAQELTYEALEHKLGKPSAARPKRADGSEHWIVMTVIGDPDIKQNIKEYTDYCFMNGYKYAESDLAVIIECDNYITRKRQNFRAMTPELANDMFRIHKLIIDGKTPDEYDKILISRMVREGYVKMENGKPVINVLYLNQNETPVFDKILKEIKESLGKDFLTDYFRAFTENKMKVIPDFLSNDAKTYYSFDRFAGIKLIASIIYNKKVEVPEGDRGLNCCTMIAEIPKH
ncbi:MAG: sigma-70 family RNA polymerase sigma factor [Lachnospiraceae bacterium]|nr:sigma-70 family RNA polymerase sigma factor [Lachnospiraceae bacterium]